MGSSSSLKPVSVLIDSVSSQLLKDIAPEICLFSFCIISFSYSTRAFPSAQHVLISLLSFFASHCPTSLIPFATLCFKVLYKQSPISLLPFYLILNFNQLFFQPFTKPTFTLLNPRANLHLNWSLSIWYRWSLSPLGFRFITGLSGRITVLVFPLLCWLFLLILLCWSPRMLTVGVHYGLGSYLFSPLFTFTSWWLHSSLLVFSLYANLGSRFVYSTSFVTSLFRWLIETSNLTWVKLSNWIFPKPASLAV